MMRGPTQAMACYEMLTGKKPFEGLSIVEATYRLVHENKRLQLPLLEKFRYRNQPAADLQPPPTHTPIPLHGRTPTKPHSKAVFLLRS